MTIALAWQRATWIAVTAASLFVLVSFSRYVSQPATMTDVIRASVAMPHADNQNIYAVLPSAALFRLNYLSEALICLLYSANPSRTVSSIRLWDGLVAAMAVWWLYRAGRVCVGRPAATIACLVLAVLPPHSWYVDSLRLLAVLLHFESFLYAVRKDNAPRWTIFAATTLLLFCTGVYAEPVLLQSWLATLAAVWIMWRVCARRLRQRGGADTPHTAHSHHSHEGNLWKQLQRDSGLLRFATLLMLVSGISFIFVFATGIFFTHFSLTIYSLMVMLALSVTLSALCAGIILAIPTFARERGVIMDRMFIGEFLRSFTEPEQLFRPIRLNSAYRVFAVYSAVSCLFLPVLFTMRDAVATDAAPFTVCAFATRMMHGGSAGEWGMLAVPFAFILANLLGYLGGICSRGHLVGACAVFLPSCLYLVQQRYAVFSAPFCLLSMAGLCATACRLLFGLIHTRGAGAADERQAHDL